MCQMINLDTSDTSFKIYIFLLFFVSIKVVCEDLNAEGSDVKPQLDFATVPGYNNVRLDQCELQQFFYKNLTKV